MALYRDHVLPCLTHLASNRWLIEYRRQMVSQARGRVLKIGIGSGLHLPFYGRQVASVFGIDPSAALLRRAGRHPAVRAELVKASAEIIPFDHNVFDTVVTTWTLCTIPQVISALCEMRASCARTAVCCSWSMGLRRTAGSHPGAFVPLIPATSTS
jgi:ubiquinone/menaquinone biosynthesis C-methylase UbiE